MIKASLKCILWFLLAFVVIMFIAAVNIFFAPAMKETEIASMATILEALKTTLYLLPTIIVMAIFLPFSMYKGLSGMIKAAVDRQKRKEAKAGK